MTRALPWAAVAALAMIAPLAGCDRRADPPANDAAVNAAEDRPITNLALPPADADDPAADVADAVIPQAAGSTIPAAFQGRWGAGKARCGDGEEMAMTVTPDLLRFYESEGKVKRVEPLGARAIQVTSAFSGEGQSWENRQTLTLSPGGDMLTVASRGSSTRRVKCS